MSQRQHRKLSSLMLVLHHLRHRLRVAKLRHEVSAAILVVLVDGIIHAVQESDYVTSAVKGGFVLTVIALGVDLE